jgi:hypothetical protein
MPRLSIRPCVLVRGWRGAGHALVQDSTTPHNRRPGILHRRPSHEALGSSRCMRQERYLYKYLPRVRQDAPLPIDCDCDCDCDLAICAYTVHPSVPQLALLNGKSHHTEPQLAMNGGVQELACVEKISPLTVSLCASAFICDSVHFCTSTFLPTRRFLFRFSFSKHLLCRGSISQYRNSVIHP